MLKINPFYELSSLVPSFVMQIFIIFMLLMVIFGTLIDTIHKKNVKYFFLNAKKAKKSAKVKLSKSKRTSVILKTIANDHYLELGSNALEFSKKFSWEKIIKEYINLI